MEEPGFRARREPVVMIASGGRLGSFENSYSGKPQPSRNSEGVLNLNAGNCLAVVQVFRENPFRATLDCCRHN